MPNENLNLVPAIRAIEEQISELNSEYVKKITPYKESLAKLKKNQYSLRNMLWNRKSV